MRSHSYLNTTRKIIESYDGSLPLAEWLKFFFRADKKFGSKDRKEISHACYCYYRLGQAFQNAGVEERILRALFLCSGSANKLLEELQPAWNNRISSPLVEKLQLLSSPNEIENIFPWTDQLSDAIDVPAFPASFLIQPGLFLRVRPGKKSTVTQRLEQSGIDFSWLNEHCLQLANQSRLQEILNFDEEVVVQDFNSQKTVDSLVSRLPASPSGLSLWDCCAASGGKSILFHDRCPQVHITVSDIRQSILINLQKRFKKAGIKNYDGFIADVASPGFSTAKKFDLIICDAPCSGSGTWSRTPEQLSFFQRERIAHYANLQKKIVSNASRALKKEGLFLYITCSVFKEENEGMVEFIQNGLPFQLKGMHYLKGYEIKADTLFVALFSSL